MPSPVQSNMNQQQINQQPQASANQQQLGSNPQLRHQNEADTEAAYRAKLKQLQKYIEPLSKVIHKVGLKLLCLNSTTKFSCVHLTHLNPQMITSKLLLTSKGKRSLFKLFSKGWYKNKFEKPFQNSKSCCVLYILEKKILN